MITLYGTQGSGSAAVEAALVHLKVRHDYVDAASWKPGPGRDALAQVNPLLQIPTLVLNDGSVLTESAAILIHLGLAHRSGGLLGPDPAQAIRGLVYIAANCYSAISVIDYPERWVSDPDDATCERIRAGSRARLHHHWELFADQFMGDETEFLNGKEPGALDLLATVVSQWSGTRPHLQAARPALYACFLRTEQHPRFAEVLAKHWPK
jgi:GST-like protein